jgi:hypothetical protein
MSPDPRLPKEQTMKRLAVIVLTIVIAAACIGGLSFGFD